jgi:hypothetical protein
MFQLYIQPSSGLKEISPGTNNVYFMEFHIVYSIWDPIKYTSFVPGLISLRPDNG